MKQPETPGGPVRRVTAEEARDISGNIFMNRQETADYLGVSNKTLASHTFAGPPMYKFGARALYKLEDVENWARQQKVERRQGWYPSAILNFRDVLGPYRTLQEGNWAESLGDLAGLKLGARIATNDDRILTQVKQDKTRYWMDREGDILYSPKESWLPALVLPPRRS